MGTNVCVYACMKGTQNNLSPLLQGMCVYIHIHMGTNVCVFACMKGELRTTSVLYYKVPQFCVYIRANVRLYVCLLVKLIHTHTYMYTYMCIIKDTMDLEEVS